MKLTILPTLTIALLAFGLIGCGEKESSGSGSTAPIEVDPKIQAVLLDAEPAGAVSVIEARKAAKPGTQVTVIGRVAGVMKPFTEGYATLVLADQTLATCERNPDDGCKTPWDACCEHPVTIKESRLSIQVVGDDGKPVGQGLKGVGGLTELDEVIVTGKVAEGSTAENVIIDATGIFRKTT